MSRCPKCNFIVANGFGLMGGGYGPYWLCTNDDCDWFHKEQLCKVCEERTGDDSALCAEHKDTP